MTIDADLAAADRSLRSTYLGTNNYDMGVLMAKHLKGLKPKGGSVCLQLGNVAADNINARAAGFRDTISGKKGIAKLAGDGGWTEIAGCPLFTNKQIDLANQQMAGCLQRKTRSWSASSSSAAGRNSVRRAYAQVTDQVMAKLKSKDLIVIAGDTLAAAARRAQGRTQPRPDRPAAVRDGTPRTGGADRPDRRQEGRRPAVHRPRRMHAGRSRQVPGRVAGWRPRFSSSRGSRRTSAPSRR